MRISSLSLNSVMFRLIARDWLCLLRHITCMTLTIERYVTNLLSQMRTQKYTHNQIQLFIIYKQNIN